MNNSNIDQLGKKYNRWAIIIICAGAFLILVFPWLFTQFSGKLDFTQTGQIGDTIGGITAPIIGFMSAILIYVSFMIQYKANQMQWKAIRDEQILNRLPDSIDEIRSLVQANNQIHGFCRELWLLARDDDEYKDNVFLHYKSAHEDVVIYLNKVPLLIKQISNSGLDESMKKDFLLDIINIDNNLYEALFELQYYLNQAFTTWINTKEYKFFIDDNVRRAKVLLDRINSYESEITRIRQIHL